MRKSKYTINQIKHFMLLFTLKKEGNNKTKTTMNMSNSIFLFGLADLAVCYSTAYVSFAAVGFFTLGLHAVSR